MSYRGHIKYSIFDDNESQIEVNLRANRDHLRSYSGRTHLQHIEKLSSMLMDILHDLLPSHKNPFRGYETNDSNSQQQKY